MATVRTVKLPNGSVVRIKVPDDWGKQEIKQALIDKGAWKAKEPTGNTPYGDKVMASAKEPIPPVIVPGYPEIQEAFRRYKPGELLEPGMRAKAAKLRAAREPSTIDLLSYGFEAMDSLTESLDLAANRLLPLGRFTIQDDEGNWTLPKYEAPDEALVEAYIQKKIAQNAGDEELADELNTSMIEIQQDKINNYLKDKYPDIHGTEKADSVIATVGKFAGAVTDPSTLIPFGGTVKSAIGVGGAIGGADVAGYQYGQEGKVDPVDVAIGAALGGALSGLITAGGKAVTSWLRGRKEDSIPVSIDEVQYNLDKYKVEGDSRQLADIINERLGLNKSDKELKDIRKQKRKDVKASIKEDPEMSKFFDRYAETEDALRAVSAKQAKTAAERVAAKEAASAKQKELLRRAEEDHVYKQREYEVEQSIKKLEDTYVLAKKNDIEKMRTRQLAIAAGTDTKSATIKTTDKELQGPMAKAFDDAVAKEVKLAQKENEVIQLYNKLKEREASAPAKKAARISRVRAKIEEDFPDIKTKQEIVDSPIIARLKNNLRNQQGGGISQNVLTHIASSGTGAAVGGAYGGEEGALLGAAIGLGLPWTSGVLYSRLGSMYNWTNKQIVDNWASIIVQPDVKLRTMGRAGTVMADRLRNTLENIDIRTGTSMFATDKLFNKLPKAERALVVRALQKEISPSKLTKNGQAAYMSTKSAFRNILRESVQAGILTSRQAAKLATRAEEKGYWPRVYDNAFLSSKKGKELWVDTFTSIGWKKEDLEETLSSLLGKNSKAIQEFINLAEKKGGQYWLSRKQTLKLLEKNRKNNKVSRSGHLERSRTIEVKSEEVLRPFLVDDPHAVLTSYFHDAYKRIEMSKAFGANDEAALKMFGSMEGAGIKDSDVNYARQLYWTAVGDSKSEYVSAAINLSDARRRFYGFANAFETLKLTFAQSINMGQALVNGTTLLAGKVNPVRSDRVAIKALFKSFGKDGKAFADQSGAAAETAILQTVGEFSEASSILGKELTGIMSPLELLNNPTKFLKATGFIAVERFQRNFAANMGKGYAEYLVGKKALIDSGKITGSKAKKWLEKMDEIGIRTDTAADKIPEEDMLRASLRFSNIVNFRNTPNKFPLAWNSPHAKIFTKFKSFAFHHGAFIRDRAIKPAVKDGNFLPLMNYLMVGTPIGMTVDEFRRVIKGDTSDLDMTTRLVRGFTSVGGLGIMLDVAGSAAYSGASAIASVAGPFAGDVGSFLSGAVNSLKEQSPAPIIESMVKSQVFPGKKLLLEELKAEQKGRSRASRRAKSRRSSRRESRR